MKGQSESKRTKNVSISLTITVDENATQEEIADRLAVVLRPMAESVKNVSDVAIRTVPRTLPPDIAGGYETRLWEKATCRILEGREDPIYPVDHELEEVAKDLDRVSKRLGGY